MSDLVEKVLVNYETIISDLKKDNKKLEIDLEFSRRKFSQLRLHLENLMDDFPNPHRLAYLKAEALLDELDS